VPGNKKMERVYKRTNKGEEHKRKLEERMETV
jgi:hypothetical protein